MRNIDKALTETLNKARRAFPIPSKYLHTLIMSTELFIELWSTRVVDFEYYSIDNTIYYQEHDETISISFITVKACSDVQIKILEYIIKNKIGSLPVLRVDQRKNKLKIV